MELSQPDLLSFAAITDEPPPAFAATAHDRCIVPIRQINVKARLSPDHRDLDKPYEFLDGTHIQT